MNLGNVTLSTVYSTDKEGTYNTRTDITDIQIQYTETKFH